MPQVKCYCPNCIYIKSRICTICLLCFLNSRNSHLFCQLLLCSLLIFPKSLLIFFFERSIFSFTEVILWFSSPSISECLSHMVELQCFVSEMLQPFSLITTYDPHGTPAIHLQQQKWVCLDTIYPCLLFSVALLCFRAIISAAVKLCLYTYFYPECRWKEYQSD